jgi:hypothetical protein
MAVIGKAARASACCIRLLDAIKEVKQEKQLDVLELKAMRTLYQRHKLATTVHKHSLSRQAGVAGITVVSPATFLL